MARVQLRRSISISPEAWLRLSLIAEALDSKPTAANETAIHRMADQLGVRRATTGELEAFKAERREQYNRKHGDTYDEQRRLMDEAFG